MFATLAPKIEALRTKTQYTELLRTYGGRLRVRYPTPKSFIKILDTMPKMSWNGFIIFTTVYNKHACLFE